MTINFSQKMVTDSIPDFIKAPPESPPGIDGTLASRGATYGLFKDQAQITQQLKEAMHEAQKWSLLPDDMKESLDMIALKIARILNGDPTHEDSWRDIAGYALLIQKRLTPKETK